MLNGQEENFIISLVRVVIIKMFDRIYISKLVGY